MDSVADTNGVDLSKYKVVHENEFAFSGMQTGRDECIRIALNQESEPIIVSPAYTVLKVNSESVISHYILLWFSRNEIDRYGWFASDASIRSNLDLERFFDMEIPLPSVEIQKNIVKIFRCYIDRQRIAEALKEQLKNICPVLIRGSLEE
jgi:type I restriction enzyme S subunit